jgi:hypothetical protein
VQAWLKGQPGNQTGLTCIVEAWLGGYAGNQTDSICFCLLKLIYGISYLIIFFSYNKSANNTFNYDFSTKPTTPMTREQVDK